MSKIDKKPKQKIVSDVIFDSEKNVKYNAESHTENVDNLNAEIEALDMNKYLQIDNLVKKNRKSPASNYLIYNQQAIKNEEYSELDLKVLKEDKQFFNSISDMNNTSKNELLYWSFPLCPISKIPFIKKIKLLKKEDLKLLLLSKTVDKYEQKLKNIQDINQKEELEYKKMLTNIQSFKLRKLAETKIYQDLNRKRRNIKSEEKKRDEIKNEYIHLLSAERDIIESEQSKIDLLINNKNYKNIDDIIKFIEDNKK